VQGAEVRALQGVGDYIESVSFLEVEVSKEAIYEGGALFEELDRQLALLGFESTDPVPWHGDIVYRRKFPRTAAMVQSAVPSPPPQPFQFHSQFGQDRFVYETFFRNAAGGVFFEAGIAGGEQISNTLFFERQLGWSGLLVEANPIAAERARASRRATVVTCALADTEEPMLFIEANLLGGLLRFMPPQQIRLIERTGANPAHRPIFKLSWVDGKRLDTVLLENGISAVDYFSLDIEGGEPAAMSTLDFAKVHVKVMTIEAKGPNEAQLLQLLTPHGFRVVRRLQEDLVFVHESFSPA